MKIKKAHLVILPLLFPLLSTAKTYITIEDAKAHSDCFGIILSLHSEPSHIPQAHIDELGDHAQPSLHAAYAALLLNNYEFEQTVSTVQQWIMESMDQWDASWTDRQWLTSKVDKCRSLTMQRNYLLSEWEYLKQS